MQVHILQWTKMEIGIRTLGASRMLGKEKKMPTLEERIRKFSKVNQATGCVEWTGAGVGREKYAAVWYDGQMRRVARLLWEMKKGPIAKGLCVCHKCDNPKCINLDHIFLGTNAENFQDMVNKGRMATGERIAESKLTDETVRQIVELHKEGGRSVRSIAKQFNINHSQVSRILNGKAWKHLTQGSESWIKS